MTNNRNPLDIFARKQRVGHDDADAIALQILCHFDAAKRGQCTAAGANFLTTHLIIASYLASRLKSKRFHDQVTAGYVALKKASDRPTNLLDLTTKEHKQIAAALKTYLGALPSVEVGLMDEACRAAAAAMQ